MGSGSDIAIEAARMTVLSPDLRKIPEAIRLSRLTVRTVRENLFWAFIYNLIGVPVAAGLFYPLWGFQLDPMIAGAAMAMSSVSVVANSLRLKRRKIGQPQKRHTMEKRFRVEGMMCDHCRAHVEKALNSVAGVSASVTLSPPGRRRRLRRRYRPRGDVAAGRGRAGRRLPPDRALIRRLLCGEHSRGETGEDRTSTVRSSPLSGVSLPQSCRVAAARLRIPPFGGRDYVPGHVPVRRASFSSTAFCTVGYLALNLAKVSRERPKWRQMSPMERSSFSISITAVRFSMSTCNLV